MEDRTPNNTRLIITPLEHVNIFSSAHRYSLACKSHCSVLQAQHPPTSTLECAQHAIRRHGACAMLPLTMLPCGRVAAAC